MTLATLSNKYFAITIWNKLPASGQDRYISFQDFLMRKLRSKPKATKDEFIVPCPGFVCENGLVASCQTKKFAYLQNFEVGEFL